MIPSTGRIVHYVSLSGSEQGGACRAAIVTAVQPGGLGMVSLAVLSPSGLFFRTSVRQDEDGHRGGTWHWPERVPG